MYPPLGTLGTTFTSPKLGEPIEVLIDIVRYRGGYEMHYHHLESLSKRYGKLAKSNVAFTGRPLTTWDFDRMTSVRCE